jgi:pimeloyl-ACP methyl ester carboxylesterase
MNLELITGKPHGDSYATPILFVHGAWHGAWCWDEHFLAYFAEQGFNAYALSLRNHGKSERVGQLRWKRAADYVADVAEVVRQIGEPPALVGHSLGGYIVQKYMEKWPVPAAVLVSSVPPRGALGASLRTLRRLPWAFIKANLQLSLWPIIDSPQLTRDAFFSKEMPAEQVNSYFARMQDESYLAYLDMVFLNLPRPRRVSQTPMLVLGGTNDAIFTPNEARATARRYNAEVEIFSNMAHDMMLESGWQAAADRIVSWLKSVPGIC